MRERRPASGRPPSGCARLARRQVLASRLALALAPAARRLCRRLRTRHQPTRALVALASAPPGARPTAPPGGRRRGRAGAQARPRRSTWGSAPARPQVALAPANFPRARGASCAKELEARAAHCCAPAARGHARAHSSHQPPARPASARLCSRGRGRARRPGAPAAGYELQPATSAGDRAATMARRHHVDTRAGPGETCCCWRPARIRPEAPRQADTRIHLATKPARETTNGRAPPWCARRVSAEPARRRQDAGPARRPTTMICASSSLCCV